MCCIYSTAEAGESGDISGRVSGPGEGRRFAINRRRTVSAVAGFWHSRAGSCAPGESLGTEWTSDTPWLVRLEKVFM